MVELDGVGAPARFGLCATTVELPRLGTLDTWSLQLHLLGSLLFLLGYSFDLVGQRRRRPELSAHRS